MEANVSVTKKIKNKINYFLIVLILPAQKKSKKNDAETFMGGSDSFKVGSTTKDLDSEHKRYLLQTLSYLFMHS